MGNVVIRERVDMRLDAAAAVEELVDAVDGQRSRVFDVAGVAELEDPAARDGDEAA